MPDNISEGSSENCSDSKKSPETVKDSPKVPSSIYTRQQRKAEIRRICMELMGYHR